MENGVVQAFNTDGDLIWQKHIGENIGVSPIMDDFGVLYLASVKGNVFAMTTDSDGPANSSWPMHYRDGGHTGSVAVSQKTECGGSILLRIIPILAGNARRIKQYDNIIRKLK